MKETASVSYNPENEGFYIGDMSKGMSSDNFIRLAYLNPNGFNTNDEKEALVENEALSEMFDQAERARYGMVDDNISPDTINNVGLMRLVWGGLCVMHLGQSLNKTVRKIGWNNDDMNYDVAKNLMLENKQFNEMTLNFKENEIKRNNDAKVIINIDIQNIDLVRLTDEYINKIEEGAQVIGKALNTQIHTHVFDKVKNVTELRGSNNDLTEEIGVEVAKLMKPNYISDGMEITPVPDTLVMNPTTYSLFKNSPHIASGHLTPYCDWMIPDGVIYLLDKKKIAVADGVFVMKLYKNGRKGDRIQMIKYFQTDIIQENIDRNCVKIILKKS